MNILLKSAKIIDQNSEFHQQIKDLLIEKGIITKIADKISKPQNCKEVNLENLHISTGWFDTSVSFGEPGFEERETIHHGLEVAAKSGFTAVGVNPNTYPVVDNKSAVEYIKNKAFGNAVELYPIANLSKKAEGKEIAEMFDMQNSGAIAFGDYNKAIDNTNLLKVALLYAQNFDGMVLSFPQEKTTSTLGYVNEGVNSTRLGLKSIPSMAEELQIARDLFLLEYTGGKLHIPTVSSAKSVKLIKEAKKKGLQVTCSVSAHHLSLTDDELKNFNTNIKVLPPLRTKKDVNALIKGVKDGTIDIITSDHNPIDIEHKKVEFENAMYGTIGLESAFGSINKVLDLEDTILCLTEKPRNVFGLQQPKINEGENANITLFNPEIDYTFTEENIISRSKNAAFLGKKLKGAAYGIIANKQLVLK
ncbi:MAG: dihydroorotase [Bacteroidota bacterium]